MVDEFREYARLPAPVLEALDLNGLVKDVLSLYEHCGARIEARLEPGLAPVYGDRNQLRQVFEALRELADKVTPPEPPSPPKRAIGFLPLDDKPKGSKAVRGKKT